MGVSKNVDDITDLKDMEAEIPAVGIMKTTDYGDFRMYRVACRCDCEGHDVRLVVETDDFGAASLTHYTTVKTAWWRETFRITHHESWLVYQAKYFANAVINRAKLFWQILFKGYIEMEGSTILDKQQLLNYADVLVRAAADVEEYQKREKAEIEARKAKIEAKKE